MLCVSNNGVCSQDDLSNDIDGLLEEVRNVQARLSNLPNDSLDVMENGLRVSDIVNIHISFYIYSKTYNSIDLEQFIITSALIVSLFYLE